MQHPQRNIILWLLTGCVLIFLMVVVGGITRLTQSGLSMVEWHLLMDMLPPLNDQQWVVLFEKYQQFPEYKELNYDFTIQDFKSIFWWEYIHRLLGRIIGIVFIIPFIYFLWSKQMDKKTIIWCVVLLLMGAFQGFLGWFMVKSGLNKEPHVSHFRLAIHLVTAFITFALTLWVALNLIYKQEQVPSFSDLKKSAILLLPLVTLQIIYGAFVAGLKAGTIYNTFPLMEGSWMHEGVTALSPIYQNFINGIAGVQFIHRYLAYVVVFLIIFIWWKAIKKPLANSQLLAVRGILYIVILQFLLGVFTLLNGVPISLGVLHQAVALMLFGSNIFLIHRLSK
jgi:heme a synthase